jgi:alpha-galactosidase
MGTKVTVIGGGSANFVPALIRRFIESDVLGDSEVTLMDIDERRLELMESLGAKLIEGERSGLTLRATTDQRESLVDADFVITSISVGGNDAWANDIEIPARYGVMMHVGDSIGPGGIFRTLRNAPVLESVARDVAEVAPDAHIFNYTNPAAVEALAMLTVPGVRVTALCSGTLEPSSAEWLAGHVGVSPEEIEMPPVVAGLNHCTAISEIRLKDGRDGLALALERETEPIARFALETYGVLPYPWTHWTEFFPQAQRLVDPYEGRAQGLMMRYDCKIHDMDEQNMRVAELEQVAEQWTRPDAGPVTLADLPRGEEDEGIAVLDMIAAIVANRSELHIVNVQNDGAISNLPDDAVVEVYAQVNGHGVQPLRTGALPEAFAAHLLRYVSLQKQMAKAALSGSRKDLLHAFLLDPMTQSVLDFEQTEKLMDEMLEANREHLPQFAAARV